MKKYGVLSFVCVGLYPKLPSPTSCVPLSSHQNHSSYPPNLSQVRVDRKSLTQSCQPAASPLVLVLQRALAHRGLIPSCGCSLSEQLRLPKPTLWASWYPSHISFISYPPAHTVFETQGCSCVLLHQIKFSMCQSKLCSCLRYTRRARVD